MSLVHRRSTRRPGNPYPHGSADAAWWDFADACRELGVVLLLPAFRWLNDRRAVRWFDRVTRRP